MKKLSLIFLVIFSFITLNLSSQEITSVQKKNSLVLELLGNSKSYSINYQRNFHIDEKSFLCPRIGFAFFFFGALSPIDNDVMNSSIIIPVGIYYERKFLRNISFIGGVSYTHAIAYRNESWMNLNLGLNINLSDNLKLGLNYTPYFERVKTTKLDFIRFTPKWFGLTLTQNF